MQENTSDRPAETPHELQNIEQVNAPHSGEDVVTDDIENLDITEIHTSSSESEDSDIDYLPSADHYIDGDINNTSTSESDEFSEHSYNDNISM